MLAGRPTKYNEKMRDALVNWIRAGNTYTDACRMEGIAYETFLQWQRKYPEFVEALEKADALCKATRIATILAASQESWQAAAWWLERRFKDDYALKTVHDVNLPITEGVGNALQVVSALVEAARSTIESSERKSR